MISIVVFHRSFHFKSGWVPSLASNLVTSYSSRLSGVSCDFNSAKLVIKKKKKSTLFKACSQRSEASRAFIFWLHSSNVCVIFSQNILKIEL